VTRTEGSGLGGMISRIASAVEAQHAEVKGVLLMAAVIFADPPSDPATGRSLKFCANAFVLSNNDMKAGQIDSGGVAPPPPKPPKR